MTTEEQIWTTKSCNLSVVSQCCNVSLQCNMASTFR